MTTDSDTNVHVLIDKAAKAEKSEDAIRFSQAACNAANAIACLSNICK
jgi:hypothetical protein